MEKHFSFNGKKYATLGEVNQHARKACNGAPDYVNKIARLEIGESITLKRLGTVKRVAYD